MSDEAGGISREIASRLVLAMIRKWVPNHHRHGVAFALRERFNDDGPRRFFGGPGHARTPALVIKYVPGVRDRSVALADALCGHRFDLLGHRGLDFGNPVDWHLDPISGRRAPLAHWSLLNPLDCGVVGDCNVIWALNRHQWLVHIGQAYRLTGDERYAETCARLLRDWMLANPPGVGINWASSREVAMRIISWCWVLLLFLRSKALSPALFAEMLAGIAAHASHVETYLAPSVVPDTPRTREALGLFYAAVVFPDLGPARRWLALAENILRAEIDRPVLDRGASVEQSTRDLRDTVETYLHFVVLAARNGVAIPPAISERVQGMIDALLSVRRPDGIIPPAGEADGGWLLPLSTRDPDDCRGVFSTAAAIFKRRDYASAAGGVAPETLWLLGSDGLRVLKHLTAVRKRGQRHGRRG